MLDDIDWTEFWEESDYAEREYREAPLTAHGLQAVEDELGYKLPAAYVALAQRVNGGTPKRTNHRTSERTSWAIDHVAITGIFGIGSKKPCSLCGSRGSKFWMEEWGYPQIGVYFADCPSGGHDMICLDYRECGPDGEPSVVHVDQEFDFKITFLADSFEAFIRGLEGGEAFESGTTV